MKIESLKITCTSTQYAEDLSKEINTIIEDNRKLEEENEKNCNHEGLAVLSSDLQQRFDKTPVSGFPNFETIQRFDEC